jgi:flagellar basal body rod protein FlgC
MWFLLKYLVPALGIGGLIIWNWGDNVIRTYSNNIAKIATHEAEIEKYKRREESALRQRDRRQAAIDASKCAAQINDWVRNPHKIPKKFDPFNNGPLSTPN